MRRLIDQLEEGQADRRHSTRRRSDVTAIDILESMTDAFSAWDQNFRYIYVNARAARLLGMSRDQLIGQSVWDLFPESVGTEVYRKCQQAMVERVSLCFDAFFPASNTWHENYVYPTKDGLSIYWRDITERKRVEARLAYHAYLLDHIHDAVIATDERLMITAWNGGAERMYGWGADEATGRHIWDIVPVDLSDEQRAEALQNLEERSQFRTEAVTYRKDGAPVYVEGITIALREGQEQRPITGYVNIRRDVTERKQAEAVQREANERVELILESMTDRFFAFDSEWRFTHFNKHAEEHLKALGKNPANLIGKVTWEEIPAEPGVEDTFRRAMRERIVMTHELYYAPLGEWIEDRIYPTANGGVAVFQRYVTERREAEEKLRRSEAHLAEAQRQTHTGTWGWNVSTGELHWSQEQFRIFGIDPARGTPSFSTAMELIHSNDRTFVQQALKVVVRQKSDGQWDCRIVTGDGRIRQVHTTVHPLLDASGTFIEYVGTTTDVTERKKADESRKELVRRLFAAQEDERRRISRELHDEVGQHLTALGLNVAALKQEQSGRARLSSQLASLEALVTQLSSHIPHLAWQLRPTALDDLGLGAALRQYVIKWSTHFEIHAELHMTGIESGRLTTELDTALYRIMQEALNNVAKHARARNVHLVAQRQSDHVLLMIEDDGVGFDTKQAFDSPDKRLGLIGMRERATLVGGTLDIDSEMGRGTIVVARVPAPPAADSTNPR